MASRDRHIERPPDRRERGLDGGDPVGGNGVLEGRERQPRRSAFSRYVARPLGWFMAVLLFVLAVLIIVLQTDWGQERLKHVVLTRLNALFDGAELTADDLEGSIIGNFILTDVNLVKNDGERLAHVDTLQAHYNLIGLLSNRLILRDINMASPAVWMEQQENGSWDLLNVVARDDSVAIDTVETYWTSLIIQLDLLTVADGSVEARFYAPGGDSTLLVRDLQAQFGKAEFGNNPTFQVETLTARFQPPGQSYWAEAAADGSLVENVLDLGGLKIVSPETYVQAAGRLRLPTEEDPYVGDVNFRLMANPVTFDDVRPFIPGLNARGKVDLLLQAEGSGRQLLVETAAAFSRGGWVSAEGSLTPGGEGPLAYVADAEIRQLNPTTLLGDAVQPGLLNAELEVDLQGTRPEDLSGEIHAVLANSRYGEYELERATLESTVEDGLATFSLGTGLRGATLSAEGTARPFDDVITYNFTAQVGDLNLGNFAEDSELTTDLTGTLTVEGYGVDVQTAEIDADVRLAPSTINRYLIEDASLDLHLENGALGFGARVLVPEGNLMAQGNLEFGDVLRYTIQRGRFENFDVAALIGADTTRSSFTGTFALRGYGTDPQTLNLTYELNLANGYYGDINIADVAAGGFLRDGLLRVAAEADLEGSGYFDVAVLTRPFEGAETLTIERGLFRDVNLGPLLGKPELDTDLTGTLAGALRGFDPQTLTFDGRIDLDPSRINEQAINDASLTADLNGGNLDFNLFVSIPGGEARLEGTAQPFLDVPTYTVRDGVFENIDLGAFTGNPNLASDLSGNVSLSGRGIDPETLTLEGTFNLQPSRINEQIINDAVLTVNAQRGNLGFDLRLDLPQGDTRLAGTADLLADVPSYRIDQGTFRNFNVGALLGNPDLQTNLTGTLSLEGRGFDPETAVVDGQINLRASRINQQMIDEASITGELRQGRLNFNLGLSTPSGLADLQATADFTQEPVAYRVSEGSFMNLNLGALTNNPNLQTDLTGTLSVQGQGFDPETMALEGTIRLDSSRINQQVIQSAVVDIDLDGGNLAYSVVLDAPEGESRLTGTAQPFLETPAYAVAEGTVNNLDLGALLGREDFSTRLTGTLELRGQGFDPETMFLDLSADLSNSRINEATVIDGEVEALLRDGLVRLESDLIFEEGRAQVRAVVRPFQEQPTYDAAGTLVNVDLADILGTDTLQAHFNADFEIRGTGLDPATMTALGTIQAASSAYEGIQVDSLYTHFELDEGLLQLDTLFLRSNVADATGAGQIALFDSTGTQVSDFAFEADIKDVQPIQPFLDAQTLSIGEGHIEGRVFGREGDLNFDVTTDISSFVYDDIRLSGLEGRIAGRLGPDRQLELGELRVGFDFLTLPWLSLQGSNIEISYQGNDVVFSGDVVIDERRSAQVAGRVDLRPEQRLIEIEDLTMRFEEDEWQLLQPATITFGDEYRVSNFLFFAGDQQIAIDGVIDPNGEQNMIVTIEQFRLETVADLVGFEGLGGTMNGSLIMTGAASAPNAEGSLTLDLLSEGVPVGDTQIDLLYESERLNIDAVLQNVTRGALTVDGFIPLDLRLAPSDSAAIVAGVQTQGLRVRTEDSAGPSEVQLSIVADSFSIGWIDPFLDPDMMQDIQGNLRAEITVTGTLDEPNLDGLIDLTEGQIFLPDLGVTWDQMTATATLEDNIIRLHQAAMHANPGWAIAQGTISFEELTLGEFDIDLRLDRFRAIDSDDYDNVIVSGTPKLSGTTTRPVIVGNVRVDEGDIYLENLIAPDFELLPLTQRDLNMLEEVFGYRVTEKDTSTFVLFDALAMDLDLEIERNTWIRQRSNPEMVIQFSGNLDVQKEPFQDMLLFGTIEVIPDRSYIDQFGKRFDITTGTITINGPPEEFRMDVQAEYVVRTRIAGEPEVTITLGVEGEYGNLDITLGSDPAMPNTDIVSYIATGAPAGEFSLGVGQDLALGQLTSVIEGFAGEELGLDVIEIETDLRGRTQLVVGEYVSNDLFVSVSQALNTSSPQAAENTDTELTVEYQIMDWLMLRLVGGQTALRINLLYEQAY